MYTWDSEVTIGLPFQVTKSLHFFYEILRSSYEALKKQIVHLYSPISSSSVTLYGRATEATPTSSLSLS